MITAQKTKELIKNMSEEKSITYLKEKYSSVLEAVNAGGCYIWGTAKLARFCLKQFRSHGIQSKGFICNDSKEWDNEEIYPPSILKKDDVVVICSFYHPEIKAQLNEMGVQQCLYYEELAYIIPELDIYYPAFEGIFSEVEANKDKYISIVDILQDDLSKEIYEDIMKYRLTLDSDYTVHAFRKSLEAGIQDFDSVVVNRFSENTIFYDVGGFDGQSTLDFIQQAKKYKKIYFFEPDVNNIRETEKRLKNVHNIQFVQAVAGDRAGTVHFDASGDGSGHISENGGETVNMIRLDDYIHGEDCFVKMDVEGFELSVLRGCEKAIKRYKPMLSVSVYHKPGDIHRLIDLVLSYDPTYKVYLRHYSQTYADTRAYFL